MANTNNSDNAVVVKNLHKSFKDIKVLRGINFSVAQGTILALLGPNGAGKTTTVKILSTLLAKDKGEVKVNGYDVINQAGKVRANIGLTGQFAAVDEYLTGEENLHLLGRLYRLSMPDTKQRTKELLKEFDLVEAGKRPVKTYSGGMKRRLDLAMSLIASPPIIFLDEPTTGLDPRSRLTMWHIIERLVKNGTTILLTTQYMEEADYLADKIVVIDNGKVIAEGTADSLKKRIGQDRLEITIADEKGFEKAQTIIKGSAQQLDSERLVISIAAAKGIGNLREVLQLLEESKIKVQNVSLHRPTLDDVFLTLTGRKTENKTDDERTGKRPPNKENKNE